MIIPSFIVCATALLGIFTPYKSDRARQEKVRMSLSAIMSMLVLQLTTANQLPRSADIIPLAGFYFTSLLGIIFMAAIVESLFQYLEMKTRQLPRWVKKVFVDGLAVHLPIHLIMKPKPTSVSQAVQDNMLKIAVEEGKETFMNGVYRTNIKNNEFTKPGENKSKSDIIDLLEMITFMKSNWSKVSSTVASDLQKARDRATWLTFLNVVELIAYFVFSLALVTVFTLFMLHEWHE